MGDSEGTMEGAEIAAGNENLDVEDANEYQSGNEDQILADCFVQFYKAIEENQATPDIFSAFESDEMKLELIQSKSGFYHDDGGEGNALNFALRIGSYFSADRMLYILRQMRFDKRLQPIGTLNSDANNSLQVFLCNLGKLKDLNSIKRSQRVNMQQVWRQLMEMTNGQVGEESIVHENKHGQSALTLAILCTEPNVIGKWVVGELMSKLSLSTQIQVIKRLQSCDCDEIGEHKEKCTEGYNLFMLALSTGVLDNIDLILGIVNKSSPEEQSEIFIGSGLPERYVSRPNSLRVAAMHGLTLHIQPMLAICTDDRALALLEVDERVGSALGHILRGNSLVELTDMLRDDDFKNQFQKAMRNKQLRNIFMDLEMSVSAIECFRNAEIFVHSYIIPRPAFGTDGMSYPEALIYYNTFDYDKKMKQCKTKWAAKKLRKALLGLGWPEDAITCTGKWTFDSASDDVFKRVQKLEEKERTSLLLLCLTSHGKDENIAGVANERNKMIVDLSDSEGECSEEEDEVSDEEMDQDYLYTMGKINDFVAHVAPQLKDIPKVFILDVCRRLKTPEKAELVEPYGEDTVVLMGASLGSKARSGLYLSKLAEQIAKADGSTTLQEMHEKATQKVMKINPEQVPEVSIRGAKSMILPKWHPKTSHKFRCSECQLCIELETDYIHCGRCPRYYHVSCTILDESDLKTCKKRGIKWWCTHCDSL